MARKKSSKTSGDVPALNAAVSKSDEVMEKKIDALVDETLAGLEEFVSPELLEEARLMIACRYHAHPNIRPHVEELIAAREADPELEKRFEHLKAKAKKPAS